MPIRMTCPGCGLKYDLPDKHAGKKARCKSCGAEMKIPVPRTMSSAASPGAGPPKPKGPDPALRQLFGDEAADEPLDDFDETSAAPSFEAPSSARPRPRPSGGGGGGGGDGLPKWVWVAVASVVGVGVLAIVVSAVILPLIQTGKEALEVTQIARKANEDMGGPVAEEATGGSIRDLSAHEQVFREKIALLNEVASLLDGAVQGNANPQALVNQMNNIQAREAQIDARALTLFNLTTAELVELRKRVQGDIDAVFDRLHAVGQKMQVPGKAAQAAVFMAEIDRVKAKMTLGSAPMGLITVVVLKSPTGDAMKALEAKIQDLADAPVNGGSMTSVGDRMTTRFGPVSDIKAFAARVNFAKVRGIRGRVIVLEARPDSISTEEIASYKQKQEEKQAIAQAAPPGFGGGNAGAGGGRPNANRPRPAEPVIPADADPVTKSLLQLQGGDDFKKKEAVKRLERTFPTDRREEVVRALLPLLDDDDGFFVSDVIKALGTWQTPEVVPALIARIDDNRGFVGSQAIKTLGKIKDPRALDALASALKEHQFEAEDALKAYGTAAEPALIPLLSNADPHMRRKALDILKEVGGMDTLKAMRDLPPDPDFGVKVHAKNVWDALVERVGAPRPCRSPRPSRSRSSEGPGEVGRSGPDAEAEAEDSPDARRLDRPGRPGRPRAGGPPAGRSVVGVRRLLAGGDRLAVRRDGGGVRPGGASRIVRRVCDVQRGVPPPDLRPRLHGPRRPAEPRPDRGPSWRGRPELPDGSLARIPGRAPGPDPGAPARIGREDVLGQSILAEHDRRGLR